VLRKSKNAGLDTRLATLYACRMVTLLDLFDSHALDFHIQNGYVARQNHPSLPLAILNYTKSAQYERVWDDVTIQCRGLIYDYTTEEVVARPFSKFFNYEEVISDPSFRLPAGDPVVLEKMDGSLGIIYTYDGTSAVATRGSFTSDQAQWATKWLQTNMPDFAQPEGVTTLAEIIYPDNRIVVDYAGDEGLVLLGAIDNNTGRDIDLMFTGWWQGAVAPQYEWDLDMAITAAKGSQFNEREGVVLTWYQDAGPSIRLKAKNPRYVELHRIVTGLSTRTVWEALATDAYADLIEAVPDEFHNWIRQVTAELDAQYLEILSTAQSDLYQARLYAQSLAPIDSDSYSRKDLATYITRHTAYPGLCFGLEDGKPISDKIYAMIKPSRSLAMIVEEDA
jgi:RNA ligase